MESTRCLLDPDYEISEQRGFDGLGRPTLAMPSTCPAARTEHQRCAWLQRSARFGLLRGSFRPQGAIAALRAYLRQRERLLDYAAAHIQHMQKHSLR